MAGIQKKGRDNPNYVDKTGEIHVNKSLCKFTITECLNKKNCTVQFEDGTVLKNIRYTNIKKGNVKNPYHPSMYGVGYMGVGKCNSIEHKEATKAWRGMLGRCYYKENNKDLSYVNCYVDERWHNFQVFAEWYEEKYKYYMQKWELDKDILVKGNKVYSPKNCCLVPKEINSALINSNASTGELPTGVRKRYNKFYSQCNLGKSKKHSASHFSIDEASETYRLVKESYVKSLADMWKNQIESKVYEALYKWKV